MFTHQQAKPRFSERDSVVPAVDAADFAFARAAAAAAAAREPAPPPPAIFTS